MGVKFEYENEDTKWWEVVLGWKWPHQGFTIGYDFILPNKDQDPELIHYSALVYLGPLTIICNWGDINWRLEDE
jgi:hypothetical protein